MNSAAAAICDLRENEAEVARERAVAWMNRGHELVLRGAGMEALVAYAHAIVLLRSLPLAKNPAWANSLGAALMNRGQLLHRVHGLARADEALAMFTEAITVLTPLRCVTEIPWARRNLAGVHLNRANLLLDAGAPLAGVPLCDRPGQGKPASDISTPPQSARTDAEAALALVAPTERTDRVDAELALKARRVLCDALGQQLPTVPRPQQDELAALAGDTVDEALALIRDWTARDASVAAAFAPLTTRFFRFGCELYRRHQPHFLVEFIDENLAAGLAAANELRVIAHLALEAALADGHAPGLHMLDDPGSERALATRGELAAALARLNASAPVFSALHSP